MMRKKDKKCGLRIRAFGRCNAKLMYLLCTIVRGLQPTEESFVETFMSTAKNTKISP